MQLIPWEQSDGLLLAAHVANMLATLSAKSTLSKDAFVSVLRSATSACKARPATTNYDRVVLSALPLGEIWHGLRFLANVAVQEMHPWSAVLADNLLSVLARLVNFAWFAT
jgi:hypothetical protein